MDIKINYKIVGDISKTKIVFLHGFMGSLNDWLDVADKISNSHCSLLIDLPGHGETIFKSKYDIEIVSNEISKLIVDLGFTDSMLVGYSLGGRISLDLCINNPNMFNKIIIESANPGIEDKKLKIERFKVDEKISAKLTKRGLDRNFLKTWYSNPIFGNLSKIKGFEMLIEKKLLSDTGLYHEAIINYSIAKQRSYWKLLDNLSYKMLYLSGEMDSKYVEISKKLKRMYPNLKCEIIKNVGHNIHTENKPEFIGKILEF